MVTRPFQFLKFQMMSLYMAMVTEICFYELLFMGYENITFLSPEQVWKIRMYIAVTFLSIAYVLHARLPDFISYAKLEDFQWIYKAYSS